MLKTLSNISIMPSFYCNYSCEYCYLGNLTKNKNLLSLEKLLTRLTELQKEYIIESSTIYGGEISLLDDSYLYDLYQLIKNIKPTFITNFSNTKILEFCLLNNCNCGISLNKERPFYEKTLLNLKNFKHLPIISLSVVVLPSLLNENVFTLLDMYEELGFDVNFIQYHPSIYSKKVYNITTKDYILFLDKIIHEKNKHNYKFTICNEIILRDSKYSPLADSFVFLNPNGNFSSIKYKESIEYPVEFQTLQQWKDFCNEEKIWYNKNCKDCKYFTKCKAEHLIEIDKPYCSGLYYLLNKMKVN